MNLTTGTIGAFEAKTKLGELLERVSHGGSFTITKVELKGSGRVMLYFGGRAEGVRPWFVDFMPVEPRVPGRGKSIF